MVKVHNGTGVEIQIDTGAKLLTSIPSGGYYNVECAEGVGCIHFNIYTSEGHNKIWKGKVPCTTDNVIEVMDSVLGTIQLHFGETILPAMQSKSWSIQWWILLLIVVILGILWYLYSR